MVDLGPGSEKGGGSIFDPPQSYQVGLGFFYRGPELAIAIRQGDHEALSWAMRLCARFWNGANTLIIPVRADGRAGEGISELLDARPVENCYLHESVPEHAYEPLQARFGAELIRNWSPVWPGFLDEELPPIALQTPHAEATTRPTIRIPTFSSARMRRISLAVWGEIPDSELASMRAYFNLGTVVDPQQAHSAMVLGQVNALSPLEQSVKLIQSYGPMPTGRSLFVFDRGSFNELVRFWNLRSRCRDSANRPLIYGVAHEALAQPTVLGPLARMISEDEFQVQQPDLGIVGNGHGAAAEQALGELGFNPGGGGPPIRKIGFGRPLRAPTFGHFGPLPAGPMKRGAVENEQVTIAGSSTTFRPNSPEGLPNSGHYVRFSISGLPVPMPLTDHAATALVEHAYAMPEGLTFKTNAWIGQTHLSIELPDAWTSLTQWAAAREESVALSPPGRFGRALLERAGSIASIAALASEQSVAILEALAPTSRLKLAQRVVKEAKASLNTEIDEELVAELLQQQAHFLELRARSAAEIAGAAAISKAEVLPRLEALVEAGFIVRGVGVRCPICAYRQFLLLSEQDEAIRCRACRAEILLPVLEEGGGGERPVLYQLDGLMARAMDQDLLPAVLALRACVPSDPVSVRAAWLGVEFTGGELAACETDLLLSDGDRVWVGECKARASISDAQLERLLGFAERHRAIPVLAGLKGAFSARARKAVLGSGGTVLERAELLDQ